MARMVVGAKPKGVKLIHLCISISASEGNNGKKFRECFCPKRIQENDFLFNPRDLCRCRSPNPCPRGSRPLENTEMKIPPRFALPVLVFSVFLGIWISGRFEHGLASQVSTGQGNADFPKQVGHPPFLSPHASPIKVHGDRVFVVNTPADTVDVIDTVKKEIVRRVPVGIDPVSIALPKSCTSTPRVFSARYRARLMLQKNSADAISESGLSA